MEALQIISIQVMILALGFAQYFSAKFLAETMLSLEKRIRMLERDIEKIRLALEIDDELLR